MLTAWIAKHFRFAAGDPTGMEMVLVKDPGGNDAVAVTGIPRESVEEQAELKRARFYWNGRTWMRQLKALQNDPTAQQVLRDIGLPIDRFLTTPTAPTRHARPAPAAQHQREQNWVLAEGLGDRQGKLFALRPGISGTWDIIDESGTTSNLKANEVGSFVKSVKRPDGTTVQGPDPAELFRQYKKRNQKRKTNTKYLAVYQTKFWAPTKRTSGKPLLEPTTTSS